MSQQQYIKGSLVVPQATWRYVYNSIIGFANQELDLAYAHAIKIYDGITSKAFDFEHYIENNKVNSFQTSLIKLSLFREDSDNIYKPKKKNFIHYTNRTTEIDLISVKVTINKVLNSVDIRTENFEDFDSFLATNMFLSEFINMVNSISWPKRSGPVKATRGCSLVKCDASNDVCTMFLSVGTNPPKVDYVQSEVVEEPQFIKSSSSISSSLPFSLTNDSQEFTVEHVDEDLF